jgi:hypothetical protein
MDHDDNEDDDDNDYEDDTSDSDDDDDDDDEAQEEADAPLEDENSHRVHQLASVVCNNKDYGLGPIVPLLDASADALSAFKAVELQALTFFASRSLVHSGGYSEEDLLICFCCLR